MYSNYLFLEWVEPYVSIVKNIRPSLIKLKEAKRKDMKVVYITLKINLCLKEQVTFSQ